MQKSPSPSLHARLSRDHTLLAGLVLLGLACSDKSAAPASTANGGSSAGNTASAAGMPGTNSGNGAGHAASSAGNTASSAGNTAGASAASMLDAGSAHVVDAGSSQGADNGDDAGPATTSDAGAHPVRATGPGDWVAGDYPPDIMSDAYREISGVPGQGNNVRQYKVHIPPSYKPDVPTPLVFCIHGLGQDAVLFCVTGAALNTKSDSAGFILVMPNGYDNSWNAGTCCGNASTAQLDDVALFRAIYKEVGQHVNIDLDRVYATGLSNGAYMSYRLACEAADIFTAVAPGAGAIGTNDIGGGDNTTSDFTKCEPSRPISVLDMHGTADPLIPFSLQAPTLAHMAMKNGCATSTVAATQPLSGGDTTCVSYDGCPSGIAVTGCSVQNGGHCWFGSPDCGTGAGDLGLAIVGANSDTLHDTDAAWDFFSRMSR